ncbi:helix-loop-helix DNA-binding domain-containing protein [Usnea florida]
MQQDPFDQQQQQQQLHLHNQQYHGQNVVPPTPNSLEMHGGHAQYYRTPIDHQQLHMYDPYRRSQKDQMIFTPLVSPAVTPLDTQFQYPDYAAPAEAFSPLTSPALRAQNQAAQHSIYGAVRGSDTSDTTSPIDPNLELSASTTGSTVASLRKSKRKTSSSSTKNPARAVRQSPAMKPQTRKKQPSSTVIPPKEMTGIIEEAMRSNEATNAQQTTGGKLYLPYSQDSSGQDSVSPEALSDTLMPPPATPKSGSAGRSPYLNAKQNGYQAAPLQDTNGEPATPASLMKIRKQGGKPNGVNRPTSSLKEQTALAEADMERIMEDIVLPEPASTSRKPALKPIDTAEANTNQSTPTPVARNTPKYGPASAPVTTNTSALPSPQLIASPLSAGSIKRADSRLKSRGPKKRNSQSSVLVSPALRPKISPSIKPLLPEGAVVSAETSALLLASKSNYQNILEGNHLPGVSYPETLSTNLTSKRTSHKIAEQGRRNRINTALQEIASLLPPSTPQVNGQPGGVTGASPCLMMSGTPAQQSNSKASTVELAIEYIKSLQKELSETKEKLRAVEKGNEAGEDKGREKGDANTTGDMETEAT